MNQAQNHAVQFGLVTVRIIISALNVMTWNIQNAGVEEIAFEILNLATRWQANGNVEGGETTAGSPNSQILAKGGDRFEIDVV